MAIQGQNGDSKSPKVELVPWDPSNEQHFKRMVEQRIACGWDHEEVGDWKKKVLAGEKFLYWVKLADSYPNNNEVLGAHFAEFPTEQEELVDSATSIGGAQRRPTSEAFFPIGHIGLQIGNVMTKEFNLPLPESAIWLKSLYISFALHSLGLGRSSMAVMEQVATQPPLNADLLALDTVESSFQLRDEHLAIYWEGRGRKRPEAPKANQEWYMRQGYEVMRVVEGGFIWLNPATGDKSPVNMVFLSKKLA